MNNEQEPIKVTLEEYQNMSLVEALTTYWSELFIHGDDAINPFREEKLDD